MIGKLDMTPNGIRELRNIMQEWRNQALTAQEFEVAGVMTHIAAHLSDYANLVETTQHVMAEWKRMKEEEFGVPIEPPPPGCIPEGVKNWKEGDENKAQWTRANSEGSVLITATWRDDPPVQYGSDGLCNWCAARPDGEHAPDCHPPVYGTHSE